MNLLVVGNGFDLAHNLKTSYMDFLEFLASLIYESRIWENETDNNILNNTFSNYKGKILLNDIFKKNEEKIIKDIQTDDSNKIICKNEWVRYFIYVYAYRKNFNIYFRWVDIEQEILNFLNRINEVSIKNKKEITNFHFNMFYYGKNDKPEPVRFFPTSVFKHIDMVNCPNDKLKYEIFSYLFQQLEEFDSILVYYLQLVMEDFSSRSEKFCFDIQGKFSHILSFNYTDTASIYFPNAKIHYINGNLKQGNIILGIDDQQNKFIYPLFYKSTQRILYDFNYDYANWMKSECLENVIIIGHSLDISDKHILLDVIESAKTVTIYYYSLKDKESKIINLYKILGEEKFHRYVNNPSGKPYICLKDQTEIIIKK